MVQQCGAARRRLALLIVGTLLLTACDPILERNSYNQKTGFVSVTGISLDVSSVTLITGGSPVDLKVMVSPPNATDTRVTWSSTDPSLAAVNNRSQLVTPSTYPWNDTAVVTVKTLDGGFTAKVQVTIKNGAVTGVSLDENPLKLNVDSPPRQLTATVTPEWAVNPSVEWASSLPAVASISPEGVVTARGLGTTQISVTTKDGLRRATKDLSVVASGVVSGLTVTPSLDLVVGGDGMLSTGTLTATILPANAANPAVKWSVSNSETAAVSDAGVVTALGPGTTTVTATSLGDGQYTAKATLTISAVASPFKRNWPLSVSGIQGAAYSRVLDRLIFVSSTPASFVVLDPATGVATSLALPHSPLSLGLSPDGLHAAVGYDKFVGVVDLLGGIPTIAHTWPIATHTGYGDNRGAIGSISLDNRGVIYAIDTADQWIDLRRINAAGVESFHYIQLLGAGDLGQVHPGNQSFYSDNSGSWISRTDISDPTQEKPVSYTKAAAVGPFWFFDTGSAMVGTNRSVLSVTQVKETDLAPIGTLQGANSLRWADHHSQGFVGGQPAPIAAIPYYWWGSNTANSDRQIRWFDTQSYSLQKLALLPDFTQAGTAYPGHGRYCFWNAAGNELYALMVSAGAPNADQWQLVVY